MRYPFTIDGIAGVALAVEVPGLFAAPRLLLDGQPAPQGKDRNEFLVDLPGVGLVPIRLKFSQLQTMIAVEIEGETLPLTQPLAWYEWVWAGLPFLLVIGGGAVGGMCGAVAGMINLRLFRSLSSAAARYFVTGVCSIAALLVSVAISTGILHLLNGDRPDAGEATAPSVAARPTPATTAARPPPTAARTFVLPQDWPALRETCLAEFAGQDAHERLVLRLGRVPEAVRISVPAGLALRPVSPDSKSGRCLTREPAVLSAKPGPGAPSLSVSVVNRDPTRWELPRAADGYEPDGAAIPPRLLEFLRLGQEQKLSYHLLQTGTWVLVNDIALEAFNRNRVATRTYDVDRGVFVTVALADYAGVRRVRLLLQELGLAPQDFRLFRGQRAVFEKELQRMDFDRPGANVESSLANGSLETFAGEPETESLLLQYATRHPKLPYREFALKSLLKIGLSGEPPELLRQLLATASREHRLLAARGLTTRGDLRGWPVLAAFAEDPSLGKLIPGVVHNIQSQTNLPLNPGESALAYWERTVGWDTLQQQYGDITALRTLVHRKEAVADPWLDEYLGKLSGAAEREIGPLLDTLSRRYRNDPRAFAAVRTVLLSHPKWQVRQSAGRALVDGWKQADLRAAVQEVMARDPDHQVVSDFLRHAIVFGPVSDAGPLLQTALSHRLPDVRAKALVMTTQDRKSLGGDTVAAVLTPAALAQLAERDPEPRVRLTAIIQGLGSQSTLPREEADAILLRVAQNERDPNTRRAALSRLCETRVRGVLPVLRRMLAGSKDEKTAAVSLLSNWKDDPEAVALLQSVRNDPAVGKSASNALKRLGR